MPLKITYTPPILVERLDDKERRKRVILLDIDVKADDNEIYFDFDLTFSPKSIRIGAINKAEYYVGSTGGHLNFRPKGGKIVSHTPAASISVKYILTDSTNKKSKAVAAPKLQTTINDVIWHLIVRMHLLSFNLALYHENLRLLILKLSAIARMFVLDHIDQSMLRQDA